MQEIEVPVLAEGELPLYATEGASGADLRAYLKKSLTIYPQKRVLVPTGLRVEIPSGFELQIRPRSGFAYKHGVTVLNAPGTIDADYRGEIKVLLINHGENPFVIEPGMLIAQGVFAPVVKATFISAHTLLMTARGEGGFGHTGER